MRRAKSICLAFFLGLSVSLLGQGMGTQPSVILEVSAAAAHLFPNPAIDYINVRLESLRAEEVHVSLHNIIGNEMQAEKEVTGPHELRVRVKDFPAGYYLLAISDEPQRFRSTYKFVKK